MPIKLCDFYTKEELNKLNAKLDHSIFRKGDINFSNDTLFLKLDANVNNEKNSIIKIWWPKKYRIQPINLIIRSVINWSVRDEDKQKSSQQEVIIGGISICRNEIYIGSFCEHDNQYGISIKVNKIDIELEELK